MNKNSLDIPSKPLSPLTRRAEEFFDSLTKDSRGKLNLDGKRKLYEDLGINLPSGASKNSRKSKSLTMKDRKKT